MCSTHATNTLGYFLFMEKRDINEIVPTKSYNIGTQKGKRVLSHSIAALGCCRSIVVDRNNKVLIGNGTLQQAIKSGVKKVLIVETAGDELVVVRRKDVDFDTRKAKEIALVDNLTSELRLNYNTKYILEQMNDVWGFDPRTWEGHSCLVKELSVEECIKEGLAAVERKESQTAQAVEENKETIIQLSLF